MNGFQVLHRQIDEYLASTSKQSTEELVTVLVTAGCVLLHGVYKPARARAALLVDLAATNFYS